MDTNLLSITSVPISIEINITQGKLAPPDAEKPKIEITQSKGGYIIDAQPAQISIDTYAARSSMGYGEYNHSDFIKTETQKAIKLAYQGTARIVNEGNQLAQGSHVADIAAQNNRAGATIQTVMEFLPKENADVTFSEGKLNINYQAGDTEIDWTHLHEKTLEFTPGSIDIVINERPRVEIEYVGAPIYVPASANPDYRQPLLNAIG